MNKAYIFIVYIFSGIIFNCQAMTKESNATVSIPGLSTSEKTPIECYRANVISFYACSVKEQVSGRLSDKLKHFTENVDGLVDLLKEKSAKRIKNFSFYLSNPLSEIKDILLNYGEEEEKSESIQVIQQAIDVLTTSHNLKDLNIELVQSYKILITNAFRKQASIPKNELSKDNLNELPKDSEDAIKIIISQMIRNACAIVSSSLEDQKEWSNAIQFIEKEIESNEELQKQFKNIELSRDTYYFSQDDKIKQICIELGKYNKSFEIVMEEFLRVKKDESQNLPNDECQVNEKIDDLYCKCTGVTNANRYYCDTCEKSTTGEEGRIVLDIRNLFKRVTDSLNRYENDEWKFSDKGLVLGINSSNECEYMAFDKFLECVNEKLDLIQEVEELRNQFQGMRLEKYTGLYLGTQISGSNDMIILINLQNYNESVKKIVTNHIASFLLDHMLSEVEVRWCGYTHCVVSLSIREWFKRLSIVNNQYFDSIKQSEDLKKIFKNIDFEKYALKYLEGNVSVESKIECIKIFKNFSDSNDSSKKIITEIVPKKQEELKAYVEGNFGDITKETCESVKDKIKIYFDEQKGRELTNCFDLKVQSKRNDFIECFKFITSPLRFPTPKNANKIINIIKDNKIKNYATYEENNEYQKDFSFAIQKLTQKACEKLRILQSKNQISLILSFLNILINQDALGANNFSLAFVGKIFRCVDFSQERVNIIFNYVKDDVYYKNIFNSLGKINSILVVKNQQANSQQVSMEKSTDTKVEVEINSSFNPDNSQEKNTKEQTETTTVIENPNAQHPEQSADSNMPLMEWYYMLQTTQNPNHFFSTLCSFEIFVDDEEGLELFKKINFTNEASDESFFKIFEKEKQGVYCHDNYNKLVKINPSFDLANSRKNSPTQEPANLFSTPNQQGGNGANSNPPITSTAGGNIKQETKNPPVTPSTTQSQPTTTNTQLPTKQLNDNATDDKQEPEDASPWSPLSKGIMVFTVLGATAALIIKLFFPWMSLKLPFSLTLPAWLFPWL